MAQKLKQLLKQIEKDLDQKKKEDLLQKHLESFRGLPFWCDNQDPAIPKGSNCCCNHKLGLPTKMHVIDVKYEQDASGNLKPVPVYGPEEIHPLFDYELDGFEWDGRKFLGVFSALEQKKLVWIKKATGLGITEIILRYIIWKSLFDDSWQNKQVVIVTGARLEIASGLIRRIKDFFLPFEFDTKDTVVILNQCRIEAYPSNHTNTFRGLPKVVLILVDEGDFFSPKEQKNVRDVVERYLGKSPPIIVWVSTPNLPDGLFDKMEKDQALFYYKIFLHCDVGVGKIYKYKDLVFAKLSPSFPREYELRYGFGIGNIFPYELLQIVIKEYDLNRTGGYSEAFVDAGYGSSLFATMEIEKRQDQCCYILSADEIERADPTFMAERVAVMAKRNNMLNIDGSNAGLDTSLKNRGVFANKINFNENLGAMTLQGPEWVKAKKIYIHPIFKDLIHQLTAVEFDSKGHPDKKKLLTFDLGDCFLMSALKFYMLQPISSVKLNQFD